MQPSSVASIDHPTRATSSVYLNISHRRDIDGLRALAALSVVACHTLPSVPGGGTGVDMFFVLSGFLISGIILRGLIAGKFTFSDFYARRIRRIFPALIVVLITVWTVGSFVLLPDEYRRLGKHIATSAVFSLYIFWGLETNLPFDLDVGGNLLSQLWSLGVEEEYYLLWPLFLLCVYKLSRSKLSHVTVGITTTAIISFALLVVQDRLPLGIALVPWRGLYELSLGGLLAIVQVGNFPTLDKIGGRIKQLPLLVAWVFNANLLSVAATALLIYAILSDPAKPLFPNSWTLAPTAGTLLFLSSSSKSIIGRNLFGSSGMIFFGLISYPLYLWHFPVLLFLIALTWGHAPSPVAMLILVLSISTAFAFLTYKYIEIPVRHSTRSTTVVVSLLGVMCLCGFLGLVTFDGVIHPLSYYTRGDLALPSSEDWVFTSSATAWTKFQEKPLVLGKGQPHVLFVGDSNMQQYYPRMERILSNGGASSPAVVFMTRFGCVPGADIASGEEGQPVSNCKEFTREVIEYARKPNIDTIVISGCWYGYFSELITLDDFGKKSVLKPSTELALNNLKGMMDGFVRSGKHVYLVLNIPVGLGLDPRAHAYWHGEAPTSLNKNDVVTALGPIDTKLREVSSEVGATVIDPLDYLCEETRCPVVSSDGKSMYRDLWHLRPTYVRNAVTFLDGIPLNH